VEAHPLFTELGVFGGAYAAPVLGGVGVGFNADAVVSPASVMKVQVALAVERAAVVGRLDGGAKRSLSREARTPGPTGISLMQDEVSMSVRDLVVAMLTISDNCATDDLIEVVGLDEINGLTRSLGLDKTRVVADLSATLDAIAAEAGFADYVSMVAHDPATMGEPSLEAIEAAVFGSAPLDPGRGTRTTAFETVCLLQQIWTNEAAPDAACASVRRLMAHQLTRNRIASGFSAPVAVAAKSGGLLGVVRNEAGVVTFPDGAAYAVAVFTRRERGCPVDPAVIDAAIGKIAAELVGQLHGG